MITEDTVFSSADLRQAALSATKILWYNIEKQKKEKRNIFMGLTYDIPENFWSLFRSPNRDIYVEALLKINEEYQYNNYFLSRELCLDILNDFYEGKKICLAKEETEEEAEIFETTGARVLTWLLRTQWLKKLEDFGSMVTNIVIPDYAAVFIEAFERLGNMDIEETDVYIQNVYAALFSFQNDKRSSISMLKTALVNTKKLNKALQDMLHNMDRFFGRLLEQHSYAELLREHLEGYVEEIVKKKYHILKTSDNFYLYKSDIKSCLRKMREEEEWNERLGEEGMDILDQMERGFDDIEHRIFNMDKEHIKYVRATVMRLQYLLRGESDTKGLVAKLLDRIGQEEDQEKILACAAEKMNFSKLDILSEKSLYKRKKGKKDFISQMAKEENPGNELSREDVLLMNQVQTRYTKQEIEDFIEEHMEEDKMDMGRISLREEADFEKLILAYDLSTRKNSKYRIVSEDAEWKEDGKYRYPKLVFVRREP